MTDLITLFLDPRNVRAIARAIGANADEDGDVVAAEMHAFVHGPLQGGMYEIWEDSSADGYLRNTNEQFLRWWTTRRAAARDRATARAHAEAAQLRAFLEPARGGSAPPSYARGPMRSPARGATRDWAATDAYGRTACGASATRVGADAYSRALYAHMEQDGAPSMMRAIRRDNEGCDGARDDAVGHQREHERMVAFADDVARAEAEEIAPPEPFHLAMLETQMRAMNTDWGVVGGRSPPMMNPRDPCGSRGDAAPRQPPFIGGDPTLRVDPREVTSFVTATAGGGAARPRSRAVMQSMRDTIGDGMVHDSYGGMLYSAF